MTQLFPASAPFHPECDEGALGRAVEMIRQAKLPLLLIGAGASRKDVIALLKAFVEKTGIPFFHTQMGKGDIGGNHPKYLGTAALSDGDYLHCAISRADLIINVGHYVVERLSFFMVYGGTEVIHVNYNFAEVDQVYFPQQELVGNLASTFVRMTEKVEPVESHDIAYCERVRESVAEHMNEGADDPRLRGQHVGQ